MGAPRAPFFCLDFEKEQEFISNAVNYFPISGSTVGSIPMAHRLGGILLALFLVVVLAVPAVNAWSEPVQTKQWSEPEYTEPWSEPEYTEPWSQPEYVDPWAESEYTGLWDPELPGDEPGEIDPFLLDYESLFGPWSIWLGSIPLGGPNVQQGMDQGAVYISPDGTYILQHEAWSQEIVQGNWRLSYPREINGEVVQAIVLLDGPGGSDWAVAPEPGGKIRLLWAMRWDDGSALWFFDSGLYR